jgi:hypothetical protein
MKHFMGIVAFLARRLLFCQDKIKILIIDIMGRLMIIFHVLICKKFYKSVLFSMAFCQFESIIAIQLQIARSVTALPEPH